MSEKKAAVFSVILLPLILLFLLIAGRLFYIYHFHVKLSPFTFLFPKSPFETLLLIKNAFAFATGVFLAVLIFLKKRAAAPGYLLYLILTLNFSTAAFVWAKLGSVSNRLLIPLNEYDLLFNIACALIFIPFFQSSKSVKSTFVK